MRKRWPQGPAYRYEGEVLKKRDIIGLMWCFYKEFGTHKECAEAVGICESYWWKAIHGVCGVGPKLLTGLGFEREYVFGRIGRSWQRAIQHRKPTSSKKRPSRIIRSNGRPLGKQAPAKTGR